MNMPSDAVPESRVDSAAIAPAAIPVSQQFYWSVRRELWEYKSIYVAPLAVAGITLFAFLFMTIGRSMSTQDLTLRRAILEEHYGFATAVAMLPAFIVGLIYCLEALHGERRDRSILFWKSLPVSDLVTVLAKASVPLVVIPAVAIAVTLVMEWIMLLLSTAVLAASGLSSAALWSKVTTFQLQLIYHMVTVHVLWYAPIYAWMLLVSGWARRAAFLWVGLPPLGIFIAEKIMFNTAYFAKFLAYRFSGPQDFDMTPDNFAAHSAMHTSLWNFFGTPGLWGGLVVAAIFFAAAIRLRRYQGPI
jgi:ABC-2 type transport system permease protein